MSNHPFAALVLARALASRRHDEAATAPAEADPTGPGRAGGRKRDRLHAPAPASRVPSRPPQGSAGPLPLDA